MVREQEQDISRDLHADVSKYNSPVLSFFDEFINLISLFHVTRARIGSDKLAS